MGSRNRDQQIIISSQIIHFIFSRWSQLIMSHLENFNHSEKEKNLIWVD